MPRNSLAVRRLGIVGKKARSHGSVDLLLSETYTVYRCSKLPWTCTLAARACMQPDQFKPPAIVTERYDARSRHRYLLNASFTSYDAFEKTASLEFSRDVFHFLISHVFVLGIRRGSIREEEDDVQRLFIRIMYFYAIKWKIERSKE